MSPKRFLITICGRVQGVGFRPFIYRLALEHALVGTICNTSSGVEIDVQGFEQAINRFVAEIPLRKPEYACIETIDRAPLSVCQVDSFRIIESRAQADTSLALLPDTAMCEACYKELSDPDNRRYRYPFLHCISCGPRFSLFEAMPFDRKHTTMREFSMCQHCQKEYDDPDDRRFYSQTNCCPVCGPKLELFDAEGKGLEGGLEVAAQKLSEGHIVAVKNTGGYLLLVDATCEAAVEKLRKRKRRAAKPFALLMPSFESICEIAYVDEEEKKQLCSSAAPIVMVKKREQGSIADSVAAASPYWGVMLAHNALHYLLLEACDRPLVATSGNLSGGVLCIDEQEAFSSLSSIADFFLSHNRRIANRVDDSIVQVMNAQPVILRKARGYIPCAFSAEGRGFGAGAHMKNSFAFLHGAHLYMSQYIGDLDSAPVCDAYEKEVESWCHLLSTDIERVALDLHSEYYSSLYGQRRARQIERVQHHRAHVYAGALDNGLKAPFSALAWDGTGLGDDGTIWGAEGFVVDQTRAHRRASMFAFLLPGAEKAVREPRRSLLGMLYALYGKELSCPDNLFSSEEYRMLFQALEKKICTPVCSSMGRLFDGVSALLGLCSIADFEGHAPLLLEKHAYRAQGRLEPYQIPIVEEKGLFLLDWRPMINRIIEQKDSVCSCEIALAFHEALALSMVELARCLGEKHVLLTGGVMQNRLLVERALERLQAAGFVPYIHRQIPPNDGGIAVGQLMGSFRCV